MGVDRDIHHLLPPTSRLILRILVSAYQGTAYTGQCYIETFASAQYTFQRHHYHCQGENKESLNENDGFLFALKWVGRSMLYAMLFGFWLQGGMLRWLDEAGAAIEIFLDGVYQLFVRTN